MPAVKDFIRDHASEYHNLKITYTNGAPPRLFMHNEAGETVETFDEMHWKSKDIIQEFLAEHGIS